MDAHSHFEALSQHITKQMAAAFPTVRRRRAQSFLTDATWMLRGQRAWLRKRTAELRRRVCKHSLWSALLAWRRGRPLECVAVVTSAWMIGACKENGAHVATLRETKKELKLSLRRDRLCWIQQLARQAGDLSVKCVVQKLRPLLGPPKRKAAGAQGLPAVARLDGTLAQDPEEVRERWIEHFAANEGGRRCTTVELETGCQERQKCRTCNPTSFLQGCSWRQPYGERHGQGHRT